MIGLIQFSVPGQPKGKGTHRTGNGRTYADPATKAYETMVGMCARIAMGPLKPLEGPVSLQIEAVAIPPASWSKERRRRAASGFEYPTVKPDMSNIVKAIEDGCKAIAWLDDKQVVELQAGKRYGHQACVFVRIMPVEHQTREARAVIEKASAQ
jgi:Holliday junction resolvase RusA-like endonuclease